MRKKIKKSIILLLVLGFSIIASVFGETLDELKSIYVSRDEFNQYYSDLSDKLGSLEAVNQQKVWKEAQYQAFVRDLLSESWIAEMKSNPESSAILESMYERRWREYGIAPPSDRIYRLAVISDEHVLPSYPYSRGNVEKALENLKTKYDCDFIISCGDHTSRGSVDEWQAWNEVVTNSPWNAEDIHSCTGNHEIYDHTNVATLIQRYNQYDNGGKYAGQTKGYHYEDIEGDRFIFMALEGGGDTPDIRNEFTDEQLDFVQDAINSYTGSGFVWIVEHSLFKSWGAGDNPDKNAYTGGLVASSTYPGNLAFKNLLINNPNCIFVHGHTHFQFEDRDNGRGLVVYAPPATGGCHSFHVPSLGYMARISSSWTKEYCNAEGKSECWIVDAYSNGTRVFTGVNPYGNYDISGIQYTISN